MNYKIVAERMVALKKEKGITFLHIEKATGFRRDKLCRLLWGEREPCLSEFALLCIALGASADELLQSADGWEILKR